MVQQVLFEVLESIIKAEFSPHSHGFRPGHGTVTTLRGLDGQMWDDFPPLSFHGYQVKSQSPSLQTQHGNDNQVSNADGLDY